MVVTGVSSIRSQVQEKSESFVPRSPYQFYKSNLATIQAIYQVYKFFHVYPPFTTVILCSSIKFGRKMMYVNYLSELGNHIHLNQVNIPPPVLT